MKKSIVIIVILLMVLPTICCIFLGIKVGRLQKQVKELSSINGLSGLTYEDKKAQNYAYAAERSVKVLDTSELAYQALETIISESNLDLLTQKQNLDKNSEQTSLIDSSDSSDINDSSDSNDSSDRNDSSYSNDSKYSNDSNDSNDSNNDNNDNNDNSNNSNNSNNNNNNGNNDNNDNYEINTNGKNTINKNAKDNTEIIGLSTKNYEGKIVYLTFDDGPSIYTDEILDILAKYKVKATFFVIGKVDEPSKDIYKRIVEEGHTLGMHSYSHVYNKIYNSIEDFDKDFTKLWKLLYDTTGYKPSIFRFPGGSDNLVNKNGIEKFIRYLNDASTVYFDWNVVNGDATGVQYTEEQLIDNVLNGVETKKTSIVLMHDSQAKKTTVDSLPKLLEDLIMGGAEILPLDNDISPIQMIKADLIK